MTAYPENWWISLFKLSFSGRKLPKHMTHDFEKQNDWIGVSVPSWAVHPTRFFPRCVSAFRTALLAILSHRPSGYTSWTQLHITLAIVAVISRTSPQKLLIFIIKNNYLLDQSNPKTNYLNFGKSFSAAQRTLRETESHPGRLEDPILPPGCNYGSNHYIDYNKSTACRSPVVFRWYMISASFFKIK